MVDVHRQDHQAHAAVHALAIVVVALPRLWPHIPASHEQVARRILHIQLEVVLEALPSGGGQSRVVLEVVLEGLQGLTPWPAMGLQGLTPWS